MDNSITQSANQLMQLLALVILAGLVFTKVSEKIKIPDVVLYIFAGILLGPHLLNWINIETYPVENQLILSFGAAYILYDGGREIELSVLNKVKWSVGLLSTVGVVISTAVVGFFAQKFFGIPMIYALLMGAVIASTDPSVLVPLFKKMRISSKLKQTIISESAFNDAAGAVVTFGLLAIVLGGSFSLGGSLLDLLKQIGGGILVGVVFGYLTHLIVSEKKYGIFNQYATFVVLIAVGGAYLIASHFGFSGFMAVFIIGMFCGNKEKFGFTIPEDSLDTHLRFKEVFTVILRMMIFVLLGTHLHFDTLIANIWPTLAVVGVLIFIARPLSVLVCVIFDRQAKWSWKQIIYLMWIRETGVIPAALSGMLLTSGVLHADIISAVTFATILITLTFQASTAKMLAKLLKLEIKEDLSDNPVPLVSEQSQS